MGVLGAVIDIATVPVLRIWQFIANFLLNFFQSGPNQALVPIREDCLTMSASSLAARIRTRKITCAEAVRACIRRVDEINETCNALVENRFEEAMEEAAAVDRFLLDEKNTAEELEKTKPFLGVPFTVKDGIAIKGLKQAVGIVARKDVRATEDAEVVALLRKAGAIPIGLTNIPESMAWWESVNKIHGRTRNPYHSQCHVGGSSGGEAALNAAAGTMFGIGSDIGGSVRIPSHFCGVFGHKPSPNVVSEKGKIPCENVPEEEKIGVLGPISKFSADLKPVLKVISHNSKKLNLDEKVDIKKLRYFYMDNDGNESIFSTVAPVDEPTKKAMASIVDYFSKTHDIKIEKVNISQMKFAKDIWWAKLNSQTGGLVLEGAQPSSSWPIEILKVLTRTSDHTMAMVLVEAMAASQPAAGTKEHTLILKKCQEMIKEFQVRRVFSYQNI